MIFKAIALCAQRLVNQEDPTISDKICKLMSSVQDNVLAIQIPSNTNNQIEYYPVYNTPDYTLAIFSVPKGCVIPIHDHPHMDVFRFNLF
jgi:hypothetical protein